MEKRKYIYPAIFTYEDDAVNVEFPDLQGCLTFGETTEDAIAMGKEALELYLEDAREEMVAIPVATNVSDITINSTQKVVLIDIFV